MAATPLSSIPSPSASSSASADPTAEPRTRARVARRQALLETAESVFAERGFTGATMSEIASRAGYSAGNLYNVFDGKDALYAEVLTTRADAVLENTRQALAGGETLGETIDRYVEATFEGVEAHRGFFVMLTQTTPDFEWHGSRPDGVDLRRQMDEQIEGVFLAAMERGEIPKGDPRPYACLLHGTVNSHVARWVRNGGSREELWAPAADLRRLTRRAMGLAESD